VLLHVPPPGILDLIRRTLLARTILLIRLLSWMTGLTRTIFLLLILIRLLTPRARAHNPRTDRTEVVDRRFDDFT
jgi:hypothetical protein